MLEQELKRIADSLEFIASKMGTQTTPAPPAPQAPQTTPAPPAPPAPQAPQAPTPTPPPEPPQQNPANAAAITLDQARGELRKLMADPQVGKFASNVISEQVQKFGVMDLSSLASRDASLLSVLIGNVRDELTKKAQGDI